MPRHRYSIVACARREEAAIQAWIEYYRSIGFDHIYLYSNDIDPGPLAKAVAAYLHGAKPFVTLRHWPDSDAQTGSYLHFLDTFKDETEWFTFLDINEFLVLKSVNDVYGFMLDYRNTVDCLYVHLVVHRSDKDSDAPVLTTPARRARRASEATRMLCRSSAVPAEAVRSGHEQGNGAFWHCLDNYKLPGLRCRDVFHQAMDGYAAALPDSAVRFVSRPGFADQVLERAYVAHFQRATEASATESSTVRDTYLCDYWSDYAAPVTSAIATVAPLPPVMKNVALHKPTTQSSIYQAGDGQPAGSLVSGGANNGRRTGTYGFHTAHEAQPWWFVDLLADHDISEIRICNRMDSAALAARARDLDVLCSRDGETWSVVFSNEDTVFGLDGAPLTVSFADGVMCRFVMLRLRNEGVLHLDEIEVYGMPSMAASPAAP